MVDLLSVIPETDQRHEQAVGPTVALGDQMVQLGQARLFADKDGPMPLPVDPTAEVGPTRRLGQRRCQILARPAAPQRRGHNPGQRVDKLACPSRHVAGQKPSHARGHRIAQRRRRELALADRRIGSRRDLRVHGRRRADEAAVAVVLRHEPADAVGAAEEVDRLAAAADEAPAVAVVVVPVHAKLGTFVNPVAICASTMEFRPSNAAIVSEHAI